MSKTKSTKSKNNPRINLNLWLQKHPELNKKRIVEIKNIISIIIAVLGILAGYLVGKF